MSLPSWQLHYPRHLLLLVGAAVLLVAANAWRVAPSADFAFAWYGVLHASALAVSLRTPQPFRRHITFIAAAALLSMLTARLGLSGARQMAKLPDLAGPLVLLALSSSAGAAAYGVLIRGCYSYDLPCGALATASLLCAVAVCVAFVTGYHNQVLSSSWLAIPWWFAFSGSLWYYDQRITSSKPRGGLSDEK